MNDNSELQKEICWSLSYTWSLSFPDDVTQILHAEPSGYQSSDDLKVKGSKEQLKY